MDIKASDLKWAKVNFSDTDEAQQALTEIEKEVKDTKIAIFAGQPGLDERLARLEELEEELLDVLFQDQFDLL